MKSKLIALMMLAGGSLFAEPHFSIGVGIGGPGYYAGPAAVVVAGRPASPGPGYRWIDGYYGPRGVWVAGYWAAANYYAPGYYAPRPYYGGGYERGRDWDRDGWRDHREHAWHEHEEHEHGWR